MSVLIPGKNIVERFREFVWNLDGCENVDDLLAERSDIRDKKRADYLLRDRTVIVEQKVLEADPADKPQKFADRLMAEGQFVVYGQVSTDVIFSKLADGRHQKWRMFAKLIEPIERAVADADKQVRATRDIFELAGAMGVLVIINRAAKTLDPDMMRWGLAKAFENKHANGTLRYTELTGAIVLSELHSMHLPDSGIAHPQLAVARNGAPLSTQFYEFAGAFIAAWARHNGVPLHEAGAHQILKAR